MTQEPAVDNNLDHLYPPFRAKIEALLDQLNRETAGKYPGLRECKVFEGYRSTARQEWLFDEGRTRPGCIVTEDRIPRRHGLGGAADIVGYDEKGLPSWDWPAPFWAQLRHCAHVQGLLSGLDWPHFCDPPHVQMLDSHIATWTEDMVLHLRSMGLTVPDL